MSDAARGERQAPALDPVAVLAAVDPALRDRPVAPLGEGWDNVVYAVGDDLVLRIVKDPSPLDHAGHVAREVALLEVAARTCPVAVGSVVATDPTQGALLCRRVRGTPFDDLDDASQRRLAAAVAEQAAVAIAPVHALPPDRIPALVEPAAALATWRDELAEEVAEVRSRLAPDLLGAIDAHLAEPAPAQPTERSLCHNDLGGEHLMVDPIDGTLTGIIDWTDAVLGDPIRDLALLLGDAGEDAFAVAVHAHPQAFDADDLARARWYATNALAGTLAYHLVRDDDPAVARTERRLRRLVAGAPPPGR